MGEGLKRVAKQCGGIIVKAKGVTTRYDANGQIIDSTAGRRSPEKVRSGEWVECWLCSGKGHVMRYPFYSNVMPEKTQQPCEQCNGRGRFFVIPDGYYSITESEARKHSTGGFSDRAD